MKQEMKPAASEKRIMGFAPNVFFLGIVSFLTDISSEIIFTLVPLFLANVLGATTTVIGFVGGLSDSTEAIFKILSGYLSDKINRCKSLALFGYGFSALSKPFMLLANSWGVVTGVRFADRVGKGVRSSPRDALIANSVEVYERGRSFGLHKAMDSLGATLGLGIAAVVIYFAQSGSLTLKPETYTTLVWWGIIPAFLAVLVLAVFVKEKRRPQNTAQADMKPHFNFRTLFSGMDSRFKLFLLVMFLFTLGNSSDYFVILRAQDMGVSVLAISLMLVVFNLTYTLISLPAGLLSDRIGRRRVIAMGWLFYALVYLGFAVTQSQIGIWILFGCYGLYYGIVEGVAKAFVADMIPPDKRGTAYGLYQGVVGLTLLPASLIAGILWDSIGSAAPFYFGAALALLAIIGLLVFIKEPPKKKPAGAA
ncbi:MFS transporter [Dehalococcoides sp. THU4]|uniref:MFS transporter n=1 Tax=Dehalococcoides sp. THU4 TaxID=3348344 RepID=UPI0037223A1B